VRSHPHDEITYVAPEPHHCGAVRAMARRSFAEAFGHLYEPGSFRDFLDQASRRTASQKHRVLMGVLRNATWAGAPVSGFLAGRSQPFICERRGGEVQPDESRAKQRSPR
jgi:hypothetical protein